MTSPISLELSQRVSEWRRKALDNTLTQDDMIEAVTLLRAGRMSAAVASQAARGRKAAVAAPSAESLLDEMDDL